MKNILIPTDFSEKSLNSLDFALQFYKNTHCHFFITHNICDPSLKDQSKFDKIDKRLQEIVLKASSINAVNNHKFTIMTSNHTTLIHSLKKIVFKKKIELIIISYKGESQNIQKIIGGNTKKIITQVKCSVLIIPENSIYKKLNLISFVTDYSIEFNSSCLRNIQEIINIRKSNLKIIYLSKKKNKLTLIQENNKSFLINYFNKYKLDFTDITTKNMEEGIQNLVNKSDFTIIILMAKNLNFFQQILIKPSYNTINYHTNTPFLFIH